LEQIQSSLKTWERKILRKIYGQLEGQNGWRKRTSNELQVMYCKPIIVTRIKVRMADDRTAKKVFQGKPGGRRNVGRPKLRWLDCTENDLTSVDVKRWRKKAEGRSVLGYHSEGGTG